MDLLSSIVSSVIHTVVEHIKTKDPVFYMFVDNLNEMTIFEAMQLYRDKKKQLYLERPTSFRATKDEEPGIDWTELALRVTKEPITDVIKQFAKEYGLDKVASVSIANVLDSATKVGEDES